MKNNKGFTLMEVVIALGISAILLTTLTKILIINKSNGLTQNALEQVKNESYFALDVLNQDVKIAGYKGCVSGVKNNIDFINFQNVTSPASYMTQMYPSQGYKGTGTFSPALDSTLTSMLQLTPDPNFDVLTVRNSTNNPYTLTTDMLTATDNLTLPNTSGISAGQVAIISNCSSNTLFNVGTVNAGYINTTNGAGLPYLYPTGSQIYLWDTIVYFVNTNNGVSSLYRQKNNTTPDLVASNVDKFSILYGIDLDSNYTTNEYVTPDLVSNNNYILNVKIGLVLKSNVTSSGSAQATVTKNYSYKFNGTTYSPTDGQIRKIYYSTITLRNMLP